MWLGSRKAAGKGLIHVDATIVIDIRQLDSRLPYQSQLASSLQENALHLVHILLIKQCF